MKIVFSELVCLSSEQTIWKTAIVTVAQTVGAVVGENLQRLRERGRLTQHETAHLLLRRGMPLSRSKIAAIEAGERPNLAFADVLMLANTFNVELAELFEGDGEVALTEYVTLPRSMIRDGIRGISVLGGSDGWDTENRRNELLGLARMRSDGDAVKAASPLATEADRALAHRLNVPARAVAETAIELWGRTLTDERDFRVAELGDMDVGERQAHRGHITRELSQQIQAELDERGLMLDLPKESKEKQ
jgi:transcriptional regulator with XRE-family HTH domain